MNNEQGVTLTAAGRLCHYHHYLHSGDSHSLACQHGSCLQACNARIPNSQKVAHQPCHIHLPIRAKEVCRRWAAWIWRVCGEDRKHSNQTVLILQHAASALPLILFLCVPAHSEKHEEKI